MENCLITHTPAGTETSSTIIGYSEGKIYKLDYLLKTNQLWETILLEINCRYNNEIQQIRLESDSKGNWIFNGHKADQFKGCIDVDIPLTPFTNTLPIRRIKFSHNQPQEIKVIYCDLLEGQLKVLQQKYTRLSNTQYHYENIPNDFESTIEVDEFRVVIDYPTLFTRIAALQSE